MSNPRRIDTHQHVIPPRYAALLRSRGIRPGGIDLPHWSRSGALHLMHDNQIERAILSVSTPGAWLGDDAEARRVARDINEYTAELVRRDPDRFGFFATLTLPDVDGSLAELTHALDSLGADGVVLLANADGRYLGDPAFSPLLEELDRRRAVVFVHPGELPGPGVPNVPAFAADFLLDTTRTALSLILSGSLERHPHIRFILAHAGGFIPYISHRILLTMLQRESRWGQARAAIAPDRAAEHHLAYLRHFYWDTALSASPAALDALASVTDPSHILFGSDWPFAPLPAVSYMTNQLDQHPFDDRLRAMINRENAQELFGR